MARTNSLTNFLTDVATAIKSKTGKSTSIPAANFDTEIMTIETGGTYQSKTVTISANGDQTVTPDQGYDAIDQIVIQTRVPVKTLQTKSMQITSNMNVEIEPDSGYDGFSRLNLEVNVPGSQINNQDKTITENGTYQADENYTGLGTVTVNVPQTGNSILYESKTAMMNDSSKPVDTYGTVYEDRRTHPSVGDTLTKVFLPPVVVLNEAITESTYYDSNSGKLMMNISPTDMHFRYMDGAMYGTASYTSEDGITYINENADGTTVKMNDFVLDSGSKHGPWNNVFSNFLVVGSMYLDGVYKYENKKDNEYVSTITAVTVNDTNKTLTTTNQLVWLPELQKMIQKLNDMDYYGLITKSGDKYYFQKTNSIQSLRYVTSNNKLYYGSFMIYVSTPNVSPKYDLYELDLDNISLKYIQSIDYEWNSGISSKGNKYFSILPYNDGIVYYLVGFSGVYNMYTNTTSWSDKTGINFVCNNVSYLGWHRVDSQFTLDSHNQLLPGKISYGLYGTVIGNNSIYNNIDYYDMLSTKTNKLQALRAVSGLANKTIIKTTIPTSTEVLNAPAIVNIANNTKKIDSERLDMIGFSTTEHYILIFNKTTNKIELYDSAFNYLFDIYTATTLDQYDYIEHCWLYENPTNSNDLAYMFIINNVSISGKINVSNKTVTSATYNSNKVWDLVYDGTNYYSAFGGNNSDTKYGIIKNGTTLIEGAIGQSNNITSSICMDNNYIYTGGTYNNTTGYQIFVWNKSTEEYLGILVNSQYTFMLTRDIDTGEWYLCNQQSGSTSSIYSKIYKLTGTTLTEVYSYKYTDYGYVFNIMDSYRLANNSSCIFTVNNIKYLFSGNMIANLNTGEKADISACGSIYRTSSAGCKKAFDLGMDFQADGKIYVYTYAPYIKLVDSSNVLLEQVDPNFQSGGLSLYYNVITDLDELNNQEVVANGESE